MFAPPLCFFPGKKFWGIKKCIRWSYRKTFGITSEQRHNGSNTKSSEIRVKEREQEAVSFLSPHRSLSVHTAFTCLYELT